MIDHNGYNLINDEARKVQIALQNKQFSEATSLWSSTESVVYRAAGNIDFYNVLSKLDENETQLNGNIF